MANICTNSIEIFGEEKVIENMFNYFNRIIKNEINFDNKELEFFKDRLTIEQINEFESLLGSDI